MNVPRKLDGARVIKFTQNASNIVLTQMIFIEETGSNTVIPITALAIAKYENDKKYYLFLCDEKWGVQNDYLLDTIEEAIQLADNSFFVRKSNWLSID